MKVLALSKCDFDKLIQTDPPYLSVIEFEKLQANFNDKSPDEFIENLASFLIVHYNPYNLASAFSPILLSILEKFKDDKNKFDLFILLSKLCSRFQVAKTFLYQWMSLEDDCSHEKIISDSSSKDSNIILFEAYYRLLNYDTEFFRRYLPVNPIMSLFTEVSELEGPVSHFEYLLYNIAKLISCRDYHVPRFIDLNPESELYFNEKLDKQLPNYSYTFVEPLIRYEEMLLDRDDYLYFYEDCFGEDIVSVAGILFERSSTNKGKVFVPNPKCDFIVLPSITDIFQEFVSYVAFDFPVLLQGPIACGKSSIIAHLAKYTGRYESPEIVSVQVSDQVDTKFLLGSYVCNERPGEFSFNLGPLLRAIEGGHWIVLEDIDSASPEVITLLQSIIENRSVSSISGYESKIRAFNPKFRIFFTRRLLNGRNSSLIDGSGSGRTVIKLLEKMCKVLTLPAIPDEEIIDLINQKWPILEQYSKILVQIFSAIRTEELENSPSNIRRTVCLRDLFKCCSRFNQKSEDLRIEENVFLSLSEVFVHFNDSYDTAVKKAHIIGSFINIDKNACEYLLRVRKPTFDFNRDLLRIGRGLLDRRTNSDCFNRIESKFAFTTESLQLLERLLCSSLMNNEPVLLCGETGVGKTSSIQYLANLLNKKLTVVNMNQQSDSVELFGGYKPINFKFLIEPLCEAFMNALTPTFKQNNHLFIKNFNNDVLSSDWEMVVERIDTIIEMLYGKKSYNMNLQKWNSVHDQLNIVKAHIKSKNELIFGFVDGSLTKAMKNGEWILLDEINLAEPETLQSLLSLFESNNKFSLFEKANNQTFQTHPDFRMFACMNPATDVGKRSLPVGIQSRFTEFYIHEMLDENQLRILVENYLGSLFDAKLVDLLVKFYLNVKNDSSTVLKDLNGHRPIYSLRNLCRALRIASKNPFGNAFRSLYESLILSFMTNLDHDSGIHVQKMIEEKIFKNYKAQLKLEPSKTPQNCVVIEGFPVPIGNMPCEENSNYIQTRTVIENKKNICRILAAGCSLPILLQGETSVGKTSMIKFLARLTGHVCVRVNNHEHTDLQDYIGAYTADENGKLVFKEGVLAKAMREGSWLILDELNLAPTDVLEALNRVLDDNRELYIPETKELIKAHPDFTLFATQNPPGKYGGRKMLSRAFRNRFIELNFEEFTHDQLEEILHKRCKLPASYAKKMVSVMIQLQKYRSRSDIFAGKNGLITLRDLFRWGDRYSKFSQTKTELHDWKEFLAFQGYYLLGGRSRNQDECDHIRQILSKEFQTQLTDEKAFYEQGSEFQKMLKISAEQTNKIVWTNAFKRLGVLIEQSILYNEPVLLVGETGSGKTTICQYFSKLNNNELVTINCHQNTECSDFLGSYRPNRSQSTDDDGELFLWENGPLVNAVTKGQYFLIDEISLADDSVLERLNSLFETEKKLYLTERSGNQEEIIAHKNFRCFATMNPGGDFGKRELSPAFRDRFTEIWCPTFVDRSDIFSIIVQNLSDKFLVNGNDTILKQKIAEMMYKFFETFHSLTLDHAKANLFSIRDILMWTEFMNKTFLQTLSLKESFYHGAKIVRVDSLGTKIFDNEKLRKAEQSAEKSLRLLLQNLNTFDALFPPTENSKINNSLYYSIEKFTLKKGQHKSKPADFYFSNKSQVYDNVHRIVRAMQLNKPILLEGQPGVGKTSMIEALASFTDHNLIRINLSEQTDISDLFGCDLPMEDNSDSPGRFQFCEGPLLKALKSEDTWILLDEMNLASQTVLEGLNACLDHRGEIFIPELNRKFVLKPENTRIFATQNPCSMDGSRKGLPKSFLNRFIVVYMDLLKDIDCRYALSMLFPKLNPLDIKVMVNINRKLLNTVQANKSFARLGGPFEFNLRDLTRWAQALLSVREFCPNVIPQRLADLIYTNKMRTDYDREVVRQIIASPSSYVDPDSPDEIAFYIDPDMFQMGYSFMAREQIFVTPERHFLFHEHFETLQSTIKCIEKNWLAILIGGPGSGKTHLIRLLSAISGHKLVTISANNEMDTNDLLGGFEQKSIENDFSKFQENFQTFVFKNHTRLPYADIQSHNIWFKLAECQSKTLSKFHIFQRFEELLEAFGDHVESSCISQFSKRLGELRKHIFEDSTFDEGFKKSNGSFEWVDSKLIRAVEQGHWLLIDNANLLNASVLDRLNSLFEPGGTLVINERGSNCEPIKRHPNFRAFLTMDPANGELSRAMKNRGIEIVVPELTRRNAEQLYKKHGLSYSNYVQQDMEIGDEDLNEIKVICKEFFDHFRTLELKSQYGLASVTVNIPSAEDKYEMPFAISEMLVFPIFFDAYRDQAITFGKPYNICDRLLVENSSSTEFGALKRINMSTITELEEFNDSRENPYYFARRNRTAHLTLRKLIEISMKNMFHSIFNGLKLQGMFLANNIYPAKDLDLICSSIHLNLTEADLVNIELGPFLTMVFYAKKFIDLINEGREERTNIFLYRIIPVMERIKDAILDTQSPELFDAVFSSNLYLEFAFALRILLQPDVGGVSWVNIMKSLNSYDECNFFHISSQEGIQRLQEFESDSKINLSMIRCSVDNVNEPPNVIHNSELFFEALVIKQMIKQTVPVNEDYESFFKNILQLHNDKRITLSPLLYCLAKHAIHVQCSPDLLCFLFEFIQNHLSLKKVYEYFRLDDSADFRMSNTSLTFEHFPIIQMTLFNAFQSNDNVTVKKYLSNRSTLDFYHCFILDNFYWLKMDSSHSFTLDYSMLAQKFNFGQESPFELATGFEIFKIGRSIMKSNRLSALPFDPREYQLARIENEKTVGEFVKNELENRKKYVHFRYGYSGKRLYSFLGEKLELLYDNYNDSYLKTPFEYLPRNSQENFIPLITETYRFERNFIYNGYFDGLKGRIDLYMNGRYQDDPYRLMREVINLQTVLVNFTNQLRQKYPDFHDIVIPYSFGLWLMIKGIQEIVEHIKTNCRKLQQNNYNVLFRYTTVESSYKIAETCFNFTRNQPILNDSQAVKSLSLSILMEVDNSFKFYFDIDSEAYKFLIKFTETFLKEWEAEKAKEEDEELKRNALFHMKLGDTFEEDDLGDDEGRAVRREFPSCDKVFEDFFEDNLILNASDKNKGDDEEDNQKKKQYFSNEFHLALVNLHLSALKYHKKNFNVTQMDFASSFQRRFKLLPNYLKNQLNTIDGNFEHSFIDGILLSSYELQNIDKKEDSKQKTINVYKESIFSEVNASFNLVLSLKRRIKEIMNEIDNEHPTLVRMLEIIDRFENLKINSPLLTFCSGLELLLKTLEEWQNFGHREIKMLDFVESITALILKWRSFEIKYWNELLETVHENIDNYQLEEYWLKFLSRIDSNIHNEDFTQEFIKLLKYFMELSSVGQFNIRLKILESLYFYLNSLNQGQTRDQNCLLFIIGSIHSYYQRFQKQINDYIKKVRAEIEKELTELVKISNWTPKNFWSIKENLRKTHKQLFSIKRRYQQILQRKSHEIFALNSDENALNLDKGFLPVWLRNKTNLSSFISSSKMSPSLEVSLSSLQFSNSNCVLKYHKRSNEVTAQIQNGCQNYLIPSIRSTNDFNKALRDNIKELSQLKPKEDPRTDKEKWKKAVGLIQTRKRRALGELFKELRAQGLSYQKGLISFDELTIDHILLKYGFDMKYYLHGGEWNCVDESLQNFTQNCDILLHRCTTLFMQFTAIVEKPNEEITLDYLNRMKGFSKSLFSLILQKRQNIIKQLRIYDQLSSNSGLFKNCQKLTLSKNDIIQTKLPINDVILVIERSCSFLKKMQNIQAILQQEPERRVNSVQVCSSSYPFIQQEHLDSMFKDVYGYMEAIVSMKNHAFYTVEDINLVTKALDTVASKLNEFMHSFKDLEDVREFAAEVLVLKANIESLRSEKSAENNSVLFEKIITKNLLVIESIYKSLVELKNCKTKENEDDSEKDRSEPLQHERIFVLLKDLNSQRFQQDFDRFVSAINAGEVSFEMIQSFGLFFQQYLDVYRILLELSFASLSSNSLVSITLLNLFNELIVKGFCKPEEPQESEKDDKFDLNDMKNTGFGDGDTTGAEDVSDRLDCQDQLDELKKQDQDDDNEDEKNDQDDLKDEKDGLEMDDDFDGKEYGPEDKEEQDQKGDDEDDKEEDGDDENLDDKMGNVENDDEVLDENIWGDEEDNNLDDLGDCDDQKGKESLDKQTVANENDEITDKPEDHENIDEKQTDENGDDENEEMNDDYKGEEASQMPDDPNDPSKNEDRVEFADQMELDDPASDCEEEKEGNDGSDNEKQEQENDDAEIEEDTLDDSQLADLEKIDDEKDDNIVDEPESNNNINTEQNENPDQDKDDVSNQNDINNDQNAVNQQQNQNSSALSDQPKAEEQNNDKNDLSEDQSGQVESSLDNQRTAPANEDQDSQVEEQTEEVSGQKDRSSKRTLAEEFNNAKRRKILPTGADDRLKNREQFKSETVKHVEDAEKADDVALDAAVHDDLEQQNIDDEQIKNPAQLAEEMDIDEAKPLDEDLDQKAATIRQAAKNDEVPLPKIKDEEEMEICQISGDFAQTSDVKPEALSSFHYGKFECSVSEQMDTLSDLPVPSLMGLSDSTEEGRQRAMKLFQERTAVIEPLIYELCNQLQLVLEPTKCSKFKGDYKTGKRLNMRKVIAYIASDFRKDKIWLRRSKPSKRQYQILIAVDDSRSMDDNQSKIMAFDSLLLLGKAFSIIEAGSIGVLKYGQESEVVHPLDEPFTEDSVLKTFQAFTFNQTKTLYSSMLNSAIAMLRNARQNASQGVHQLLVIVSDGRGISPSEPALQSALVRLREMNIFSVFIIIDNPEHKNSIVDLQSFSFRNGVCKSESYIEHFPFPYYVILKSVTGLPTILGDSLRQWFEMINMH